MMNQEKGENISLKVRTMMIVIFAISYGWIAPKWFDPHRHDPLSFRIFVTLHAITLAGAVVLATGGRKPKGYDFAAREAWGQVLKH